jgi:hypothetical protein
LGLDLVGNPYYDALVQTSLQEATEAYASRFGPPGSYRAAWRSFRWRIQTDEDLRLARRAARTRAALGARSEARDDA